MNHIQFFEYMREKITVHGETNSVLKDGDANNPRCLVIRIVELALKLQSYEALIEYFELLTAKTENEQNFLTHFQIFISGAELQEARCRTLIQFSATLFTEDE